MCQCACTNGLIDKLMWVEDEKLKINDPCLTYTSVFHRIRTVLKNSTAQHIIKEALPHPTCPQSSLVSAAPPILRKEMSGEL